MMGLMVVVVVLLHLAARTADGGMRWSGVWGKDGIGWLCIWVQGGERFPSL